MITLKQYIAEAMKKPAKNKPEGPKAKVSKRAVTKKTAAKEAPAPKPKKKEEPAHDTTKMEFPHPSYMSHELGPWHRHDTPEIQTYRAGNAAKRQKELEKVAASHLEAHGIKDAKKHAARMMNSSHGHAIGAHIADMYHMWDDGEGVPSNIYHKHVHHIISSHAQAYAENLRSGKHYSGGDGMKVPVGELADKKE